MSSIIANSSTSRWNIALHAFARLSRAAANRLIAAVCLSAAGLQVAAAQAPERHAPQHDYPTAARADYVVGCLAANGFQHDKLDGCACSIDVIANYMSYEDYELAGTIMSMQQASVGPRGGLFRDTPVAKQTLERLNRAQAEALLRCAN